MVIADGVVMALPPAFLLKKILSLVVLPPVLPMLCIAFGLLLQRRRPVLGRGLAWGGLLLLWLLSTPATLEPLIAPLEDVPVLQPQDLGRAQAIVILGAGYRRHMPEYGGPAPNRLALERLRYGARLAGFSGLPVLVSGEARLMAESLWDDFGIAARWQEGDSLDTAENARYSAHILQAEGITRIALVTHAIHMRRAMGEFAASGIEVIPAPTGFLRGAGGEPDAFDYLPSPSTAYESWLVTHEWLGLLVQRLRNLLILP